MWLFQGIPSKIFVVGEEVRRIHVHNAFRLGKKAGTGNSEQLGLCLYPEMGLT